MGASLQAVLRALWAWLDAMQQVGFVLEPADEQELYALLKAAFDMVSEDLYEQQL